MCRLSIILIALITGCLFLAGFVSVLPAQETVPTPGKAASPATPAGEKRTDPEKALTTMRALKASISKAESEIREKRAELEGATTDTEREAIGAEIQKLNGEIAQLRADFDSVAAGIDIEAYLAVDDAEVDFTSEMEDFLGPIITQMKELTARPREIDELKNNIEYHAKREQLAGKALEHIAALLSIARDPEVIADLQAFQKSWEQRFEQAENNLTIAEFQLETKRSEGGSVFHAISASASAFFRSRGRNLLIAALSFLAVFSLLRLIHRFLHRLSPMRSRGRRSIVVRVIDIVYYVFTVVASTGIVLVVFYVTDDWLLLGLSLLFLAGIAWTGKQTLPLFYEQAKLMLNLGSVREGERVVYNGIPWKVKAINIFTDLTNSCLQGGRLRIPLRDLVSLTSRPFEAKEPWFPSDENDWVILSDETFGKVISQTPEWVQVIKLGGIRKTYTTSEFIALNPENLSQNFRVTIVFGIDYQHQPICTDKIPRVLRKKLKMELEELVGENKLHNVAVEFREAGASSLDYAVLADFTGEIASKYMKLSRAIPRICVDACNEHGWVIPFTQITVHQAAPVEGTAAEPVRPAG